MNVPVEVLAAVATLALVNERAIEALSRPLTDHLLAVKAYSWALIYVAFVTGSLVGWFSGLNIFAALLPGSLELGRVITAASVGLGSSFLHELLPAPAEVLPPT